ncbi:uncharacterized protein LOC123562998 [Mercenaria mercenaria]|uniref:uncharacterized protein LOC123562998 n=1 Tax=Mercenaria mercenaria TaxID=6596 RepID=UPI00234F9570|nr:uncharacterized protein LOC123562998 [Mercenaria mercenaria]
MNLFYTILVFSILTSTTVGAGLTILKTAVEVISFGLDVYSFFDSILGDDETQSTPAPIDYDRIINRISERIEMSSESIIFKIELQAYISELRDVALTVGQLLTEMENIIKAKSKDTREELQRRFRKNFERYEIEIYRVKSLLTFKIEVSEISSSLLSLIANEFECGMTSLEEFQNYYMTLVSDVVALALLNEKLSDNSLYNLTIVSWQTTIKSLFDDMEKQKEECKGNFFELITKDLIRINDPSDLFENNQNKYPYQETDVLYLGGSYCLWSLKAYEKLLNKSKDHTMTLVFINDEENVLSDTSELQKIVPKAKYENCLDDIGNILSHFDVLHKDLIFWLMYPQSQATKFKILLDQNSTASTITTESDSTKYTTVVYLRTQDLNTNSALTPSDFDVKLYEKVDAVDESSGLKAWKLGVIIVGSVAFVVSNVLIVVLWYNRKRSRLENGMRVIYIDDL